MLLEIFYISDKNLMGNTTDDHAENNQGWQQ